MEDRTHSACKAHKCGWSQNQEYLKEQQCAPVSDTGLDSSINTLQSLALDGNLCTVNESPQTGMHLVLEALLGSLLIQTA